MLILLDSEFDDVIPNFIKCDLSLIIFKSLSTVESEDIICNPFEFDVESFLLTWISNILLELDVCWLIKTLLFSNLINDSPIWEPNVISPLWEMKLILSLAIV